MEFQIDCTNVIIRKPRLISLLLKANYQTTISSIEDEIGEKLEDADKHFIEVSLGQYSWSSFYDSSDLFDDNERIVQNWFAVAFSQWELFNDRLENLDKKIANFIKRNVDRNLYYFINYRKFDFLFASSAVKDNPQALKDVAFHYERLIYVIEEWLLASEDI